MFCGFRNSRLASTETARRFRVFVMSEIEIIRLNVERYRRMLKIEADETMRRVIQKMLEEFEAKLASLKPRAVDPHQR